MPLSGTHQSSTEASGRIADVILLFANHSDGLGVSEIARKLDFSKSVVHRILVSLASRQLVVLNVATKKYEMGPALALVGATAFKSLDLRSTARPILEELAQLTGEATALSVLVGDSRFYLDQCQAKTSGIQHHVPFGHPCPLYAGGSGKAILAACSEDFQNRILANDLLALTPYTPTDREALSKELKEIAARGYATSNRERDLAVASIAAPVITIDGVKGAISVNGPHIRLLESNQQELASATIDAARLVSSKLGGNRYTETPGFCVTDRDLSVVS